MALKDDDPDPKVIDTLVVKDEQTTERRSVGQSCFERLPNNVKFLIYRHISLIRDCPIDLSQERRRFKDDLGECMTGRQRREEGKWVTPFYITACTHPKIPVSLFLVSKSVYRHAVNMFVEKNSFKLWLRSREDLERFATILGPFLERIVSVHVHLLTHDNRLLKAHLKAQSGSAVRLWKRFCKFAAENMPSLRNFSFDCRIAEPEMATILFEDLRNLHLSSCAAHLSPQYRPDFAKVAKKHIVQNIQPFSKTGSLHFPFFCLPQEIQLMILKPLLTFHSDPMTPISCFSRNQLVFNKRKPGCNSPYKCCGTCSPNHYLCYCPAMQSVHSSSCSCFASPVNYFLVNKNMYHICRHIFYTSNQFAYVGEDPSACLKYLMALSAPAVASIRHFTFAIPDLAIERPSMRNRHLSGISYTPKYSKSWEGFIFWMRKHTNLERLNFNFVDLGNWRLLGDNTRTIQREASLLKVFFDLQVLRGIRKFQIYAKDFRRRETVVEENVNGPSYKAPKWKYLPFIGWKETDMAHGERENADYDEDDGDADGDDTM